MSLPRYPRYKDSGVEWLGEVPEGWKVVRISSVAVVINGHPFDSALFDTSEGYPLIRIRDIERNDTECRYLGAVIARAIVTADDVLVGMDGDFTVGRWRGAGQALLNQRICCVRGGTDVLSRFLEYALPGRLKIINDLTYATTVKHLASSQIEDMVVALPEDPGDQKEIVSFIDFEAGKIDALVVEQMSLIDLLNEKRQAVISHAVTKGMDPKARVRQSGIEGLGEIPAHWAVVKMKWVATMESGHTPDKKVPEYWENGDIPWVSLNDTGYLKDHDYISETAFSVTAQGIENSSAHVLPTRSVVLSRDATIGRCAITTCPMAVSQHFIAWVCGDKIIPEFLLLRLRSMTFELDRLTTGATLKTIGMPEVRTLVTPVPPREEQEAIIAWVSNEVASVDALITEAQRAIELLQERRSALITAAVTGQIDVRSLPEARST